MGCSLCERVTQLHRIMCCRLPIMLGTQISLARSSITSSLPAALQPLADASMSTPLMNPTFFVASNTTSRIGWPSRYATGLLLGRMSCRGRGRPLVISHAGILFVCLMLWVGAWPGIVTRHLHGTSRHPLSVWRGPQRHPRRVPVSERTGNCGNLLQLH